MDRRTYLLGQVMNRMLDKVSNAIIYQTDYPNNKGDRVRDWKVCNFPPPELLVDEAMHYVLAAEAALDAQDVIGQIETLAVGE